MGGVKAMFGLLIFVMRREFLIFREKKCVGNFRTFLPCGQLAILFYFLSVMSYDLEVVKR